MLRHPQLAARSHGVLLRRPTTPRDGKSATAWRRRRSRSEFRKIHQYVTFCRTIRQLAHADFLREHPEHHREVACVLRGEARSAGGAPGALALYFTPSPGTYFQLVDYRDISDEPDHLLARRLTESIGVATIPVSVFYADPPKDQRLLRLCFCKDETTLVQAAERLCAI